MKKFKSLKLMLIGLFAVMSVNAFAADGYTKLFKFTHDGTNATITGFNTALTDADKATLEIPQTVKDVVTGKDLKVTGIGEGAFKNEGKINTVTIKHSNLASIGASAFEGCGGLTAIDFSAATGLKKIGASAFKGTKISNLNLEKTAVAVIENLFGSTFAYTITGTNYTEAEANAINAALLGDKAVTTDMLDPAQYKYYTSTNAANEKNATLDGAIAEGDEVPYTKATANAFNKANFGGVEEGDQKVWTAELAAEYNEGLTGAMHPNQPMDEYTVQLWNDKFGMTDAAAEAAANAYNAALPGAVAKNDIIADPDGTTADSQWEAFNANKGAYGSNASWPAAGGWKTPGGTYTGTEPTSASTSEELNAANEQLASLFEFACIKGGVIPHKVGSTIEAQALNAKLEGAKSKEDFLAEGNRNIGDLLTDADAAKYNETIAGAITLQDLDSDPATPDEWADATGSTGLVDEEGNPIEYTEDEAYEYNMALGVTGLAREGNSTGVVADAAAANAYNAGLEGAVKKGDLDEDNSPKYDAHGVYVENEKNARGKSGHVDTSMTKPDTKVAENKNTNLTSVKLNGAWTKINDKAFEACTKLESVDFNTAAKKPSEQSQIINNRAFLGTAVKEFNFEKTNVTSVPSDFFVTDGPTSDPVDYDENTTLTTVKFNKIWSVVNPFTFEDCTELATVAFEDREVASESAPGSPVSYKVAFNGIGTFAFANTKIAEIVIPEALAPTSAASSIDAGAFYGCDKLKKFTYMVDNNYSTVNFIVDDKAFPGCKDVEYVTTNANVAAYMAVEKKAPKNSYFTIAPYNAEDAYVTPFVPEKYKNGEEKWYIKYKAVGNIKVDKTNSTVYSAYNDPLNGSLNMIKYQAWGGYYHIDAGEEVLILTTDPELKFEASTMGSSKMSTLPNIINIVTVKGGIDRALLDLMTPVAGDPIPGGTTAPVDFALFGWVNTTKGTGWQMITTGKTVGQGKMWLYAAPLKDAEGRLIVKWLDENGNVEAETTGLESITSDEAADNEAIFNLQGIQVKGAQKGVFIKNGKKYVK